MLTDTKLRNLKPQGNPYKVIDRDGLYVAVTPAGSVQAGVRIKMGLIVKANR